MHILQNELDFYSYTLFLNLTAQSRIRREHWRFCKMTEKAAKKRRTVSSAAISTLSWSGDVKVHPLDAFSKINVSANEKSSDSGRRALKNDFEFRENSGLLPHAIITLPPFCQGCCCACQQSGSSSRRNEGQGRKPSAQPNHQKYDQPCMPKLSFFHLILLRLA